jgi:hypothetical protein
MWLKIQDTMRPRDWTNTTKKKNLDLPAPKDGERYPPLHSYFILLYSIYYSIGPTKSNSPSAKFRLDQIGKIIQTKQQQSMRCTCRTNSNHLIRASPLDFLLFLREANCSVVSEIDHCVDIASE